MTKHSNKGKIYKCIFNEDGKLPNQLQYEPTLSNTKHNVWIGYCKGDNTHPQHFVRISKLAKDYLLNRKTDIFKQSIEKTNSKRIMEVKKKLRCPIGKIPMNYQKERSIQLGLDNVDIFRCMGHSKGEGHEEHYLRIHYGLLGNNQTPIIVIYTETM